MRIRAENTLVLAIDYQERLMPAMHEVDIFLRNSSILLQGMELLQVPIINTRQYPKGLGDTVPSIKAACPTATVLDKTAFSCMGDPAIKEAVRASGRTQIVICGSEAHVCCLQTAIDLLEDKYTVVYVTDCVASRKEWDKQIGLNRVADEGALRATYESILFELTAGTASPAFKAISNLVK